MPRLPATTFGPPAGGIRRISVMSALALLAGAVLVPCDALAEGGYGRPVPPPYGYGPPPDPHRCGPPRPCQVGSYYGRGVVRAYLPRNNALPMYNEPPPRFPGN